MPPLSAHDLLAAWDLGQTRHPAERALELLAAAYPDVPPAALAELSLGDRTARLLRLRESTLGPQLSGLADCPSCGERVELEFDVQQVSISQPDSPSLFVVDEGHRVEFRLPNSHDLAVIRSAPDIATARRVLFERCVTAGVNLSSTPETLVDAVASAGRSPRLVTMVG